ncbi:MAG: hypothetical protein C0433_03125 [Cyclobacterium sp.]|nr:hypothetical protein [Cyclobacterium sp.]
MANLIFGKNQNSRASFFWIWENYLIKITEKRKIIDLRQIRLQALLTWDLRCGGMEITFLHKTPSTMKRSASSPKSNLFLCLHTFFRNLSSDYK